ncbi:MAG: helix-turn-helix transcriptional regulator [Clostridia bacterium]|nr:helix-turn-helix transcriptional regulator [Clostridia bacterium]
MHIGNNIKFLRMKNQFTQEQIAERLGVSYQAVSKWETNANTPDIALLPEIAALFHISIDALFSDDIESCITSCDENMKEIKDDGVIRIVQMRGTQILKVTPVLSPDQPPISIAFPLNCNDRTQYFKVEVFGHVISDSAINGDVCCHQSIECASINGDVCAQGDVKAYEITSYGKIICNQIKDCCHLQCPDITCTQNGKSET